MKNVRLLAGIALSVCLGILGFRTVVSAHAARVNIADVTPASQVYLPYIARPSATPLPSPWQSYEMTYTIRIGYVGKLWMPVPRQWDGVGMTNVGLVRVLPEPDDLYHESQGNMIAFWEVGNRPTTDYSVRFRATVAPCRYSIDPANVGEYDTSSPEYQRYTRPSSRIESDHPAIAQLAMEIVGSETNPYEQARLAHQWVSTKIAGGEVVGPRTALSTLEQRHGDCADHSNLFVALLRALGVPARHVGGLHTAYEGSFSSGEWWAHTVYTHVWSEFYLPRYGWIQSDTSAGLRNFAEIDEPRLVLFRGEDIALGHGCPLDTIPWFNMPQQDRLTGSDPATNTAGEALVLTVERLP